MYLATYFRGRLTFRDLLTLDVGFIPVFNKMAYEDKKNPESQNQRQGEIIEDALQGDI